MILEKKKKGRISKCPSKEELSMKYAHMTAKEIADEYGVKEATVRTWIAKYRREDRERGAE